MSGFLTVGGFPMLAAIGQVLQPFDYPAPQGEMGWG